MRKGVRECVKNDEAVVLGLYGLLVQLLTSTVPAADEDVAAGTELPSFSCQPGPEALVYF